MFYGLLPKINHDDDDDDLDMCSVLCDGKVSPYSRHIVTILALWQSCVLSTVVLINEYDDDDDNNNDRLPGCQ